MEWPDLEESYQIKLNQTLKPLTFLQWNRHSQKIYCVDPSVARPAASFISIHRQPFPNNRSGPRLLAF